MRGARANNLKNIDVAFPLGTFIAVTGVSGSGKSTLVNEILYRSLARMLYRATDEPGPHTAIEGIDLVDKVIQIDQSPIGRTPRSNPATYTGLVHVHPRAVRDAARGARARLQGRALLVQRQGRPLRDLPGRRRHRHRDALPAERLRHVRGMQGPPLQPRDARDQIPRQVDRRDARPDRRSGAAARRELPADRAASCGRCRTSASATSSWASRRRRCRAARRSA